MEAAPRVAPRVERVARRGFPCPALRLLRARCGRVSLMLFGGGGAAWELGILLACVGWDAQLKTIREGVSDG